MHSAGCLLVIGIIMLLVVGCCVPCRVHQAVSKSTAKKEKTVKEKMKAAEVVIPGSSVVDDRGKSSADASKSEKSKDTVHANGMVSSEPTSNKSKLCHCVSLSQQVRRYCGA